MQKIHSLKSHTGTTMAKAFQKMLKQFNLEDKVCDCAPVLSWLSKNTQQILAVNANNATSNDTQTDMLSSVNNSFEAENRICCFNHTLQLSAKTLLKPFNADISHKDDDDLSLADGDDGEIADSENCTNEDKDSQLYEDDEDEGEEPADVGADVEDDIEDNVDELDTLASPDCTELLADTTAVCTVVSKI